MNSEVNRLLRIELQQTKQVKALLKASSFNDGVGPAELGADVLKISIIEKLRNGSWPQGVTGVKYEIQKLTGSDLGYADYALEGVRAIVSFTARHSLAMINYLDVLMLSVYPQPIEVRACESERTVSNTLRNQCVLDFYYWSPSNDYP
ncbi:MAG: hypothetical protein AB8B84_06510 [Granulosicoccus sp.]